MTQKALLQSAGDGTSVPQGYVGQVITASGTRTFVLQTGTNWFVGTLSTGNGITLTPGIWLVAHSVESNWTNGTTTVSAAILTTDTTDGTPTNNTSAATLSTTTAFLGNIEGWTQNATNPQIKKEALGYLSVASNTTYTIKVNANNNTFTGNYTCRFFAVRIA